MSLSRYELAERIAGLPSGTNVRRKAAAIYRDLYAGRPTSEERRRATRDPEQRRRYVGDPWAYIEEILGYSLTRQQSEILELFERESRVLVPSANNVGKTFLLAAYGIYVFDAVAAEPDPDSGAAEQGARILLPGPDHDTIFGTVFSEMLVHASRAEDRGFAMPGERSERSVLWRVRPKWNMEAFSPPKSVDRRVEHRASGRHARIQIALIEEGSGVEEPLFVATEAMCSSYGNKIFSTFNPTEPSGPVFRRAQSGAYTTIHLDAFDHPNIRKRKLVIPSAIDFRVIDRRVAQDCRERGAADEVVPDPEHDDFLYALPPELVDRSLPPSPEEGPRDDDVPGHPAGDPRVYRPDPLFVGQVRGQWPRDTKSSLFSAASLDRARKRLVARDWPSGIPDQIGVDPAREGDDESVAIPRWGPSAPTLLYAYSEAEEDGPEAVRAIVEDPARHAVLGPANVFAPGKGPDVANSVYERFPRGLFVLDDGGVGASVLDHLERVIGADVRGVSFSGAVDRRLPGEPFCENIRTAMYVRAARLFALDLVDAVIDDTTREELLAPRLLYRERTVTVEDERGTRKERKTTVLLEPKKEIKKRIGRSPDRADALVLALHDPPEPERPSFVAPVGIDSSSYWT